MSEISQKTELIKVEEISSIMQTAGIVLAKNENLVNKAVKSGQTLIDTAASGMSDELDTEMNNWQLKAKDALKIMNERRSPITQLMTKVAKVFTSLEANLDSTKSDSIFSNVQQLRNSWAKQKAELKRKQEQEILLKNNIANEKIEILSIIEKQIRDAFNIKVFEFKSYYTKKFNEVTLETFFQTKKQLEEAKLSYPMDKYLELNVIVSAVYLSKDDLNSLLYQKRQNLYEELNYNFHLAIESLRDDLLSKLPSKKIELETLAKANQEEAERIKIAQKKREEEENEKLKQEALKAQQEAEQKISEQKDMQRANNLFDAHAELANISDSDKPVREAYKIEVKNYAGWMQIASFWFEREGKNLAADKFEKKTLGQMKAFAEKEALKNEKEKISSSHLVYEEVFKAVVKK